MGLISFNLRRGWLGQISAVAYFLAANDAHFHVLYVLQKWCTDLCIAESLLPTMSLEDRPALLGAHER